MCFSLYLRAFRQNLTAVELRGFWHFEHLFCLSRNSLNLPQCQIKNLVVVFFKIYSFVSHKCI